MALLGQFDRQLVVDRRVKFYDPRLKALYFLLQRLIKVVLALDTKIRKTSATMEIGKDLLDTIQIHLIEAYATRARDPAIGDGLKSSNLCCGVRESFCPLKY